MTNAKGIFVDVYLDDGRDESHIFVVSDSASVVDLRAQEIKHFVWNLLILI